MDPQKITELANLLRNNGDKILNSEFTLTLTGSLLRALNDSFTLIADTAEIGVAQQFQVVKPINSKSPVFRDLQLIYDFVQKTTLLCLVHYPTEIYFEGLIDISKFRTLKRLEVQKINVKQITGLQPLRSQLEQLICIKSLSNVEDIITRCGGDNSNGFVWNELKVADFSYNNLQTVDTSLEFAQFLQHLNLRHNQLCSVEAIQWLPHLKTLDLSFNRLQSIPQLHIEACKSLQSLNMSNNFVEDLTGSIAKLYSLTDLDLSDNCLMDHSYLLPLSALINLKFLNLYGNPLHCHPKHRLATAQFLHKNTATVKFILDFEPLTKNEKVITGTQELRHVGSLNHFVTKSAAASINPGRLLTSGSQTPSSSVGSFSSFKFPETATQAETNTKKRHSKIRTVDIEDSADIPETTDVDASLPQIAKQEVSTNNLTLEEPNNEHLETKRQIENLREKFGAEWLQTGNAEMMQSLLGIETTEVETTNTDSERNKSRQLFNDYLGEWSSSTMTESVTSATNDNAIRTSTPTNEATKLQAADETQKTKDDNKTNTFYISTDTLNELSGTVDTLYESANESGVETLTDSEKLTEDENNEAAYLKKIYSSAVDEEPEDSEAEDDEETYIVYKTNRNEAIFLTISSNFLREKDTLTQRTITKWSLGILESCDRIKSNTLRINFDTVKQDKKERIYTVGEGLCQELEKKLRDILSVRDLTEMNQTIYRCVNCSCQFSRENKRNMRQNQNNRCPECKSLFVAEIHDVPKNLIKSNDEKLSPATIVEESPITTPLVLKSNKNSSDSVEETTSIGNGPSRLTAINTQKSRNLMHSLKSSANSLNGSSSCSKITNSQSSFDSNQSVAGSSNTDRDADFKSTGESDVDILSNPSQSSIEVLDPTNFSSRKTSEERRILQIPNLETIEDQSYAQTLTERDFKELIKKTEDVGFEGKRSPFKANSKSPISALAHINLTESSSSGSVTDSICTTYEHQHQYQLQQQQQQQADKNLVPEETNESLNIKDVPEETETAKNNSEKTIIHNSSTIGSSSSSNESGRKEESAITSVFGALFQSTNILMSSSKKLIDAEATANIQSGITIPSKNSVTCKAYKFNYTDFNDVDHRLKLYFYQTKFEEKGEHFKWIARGRIFNENTQTLCDGIVVMSTCKCYLMEAYASENDDVTKWLRQIVSVTVDRLESIQLLPWKIGLSFSLRDWGGFLLLLQDILRTDSLLLHFANNALPSQCELKYQPADQIMKLLNTAVGNEKLKMCSILNGCEVSCENAKRCFHISGLLTTETHLYLTSTNLSWLSLNTNSENDIEISVTQLMSNLVEVERIADEIFTINFLDDTHNKCELWQCKFETKENADSCLNAIGQSWEQLFGVPLFNA